MLATIHTMFVNEKNIWHKVIMQGKLIAVAYSLRTLKPVLSGRNL